VPIVVRQLVFSRPPSDLFKFPVGPPVAVPLSAIALVKEPLIVPLQLVVEDNALNASALVAQALVGTLISSIDVGVVGQLAGLPDAGVERLARLPAAIVTFVTVGVEEISTAVRQG
jgi:hypothetical protein